MPLITIDDIDDPRLAPYRDLRKTNVTRWCDWLIAEGALVVERLLASGWPIESVLLSRKRLARWEAQIPPETTVYLVSDELCCRLVGFQFHAGVMACARRQLATDHVLGELGSPSLLVCCPHTVLPDNLGSIIRLAAGFAAAGLVVGPQSADPLSRRAVRVSMGSTFQLPLFQPRDLESWLVDARDQHQFELVAAQQTDAAISIRQFQPQAKTILLLGNEYEGLAPQWLDLCRRTVEIPMSDQVDSLNVTTATAILLYELSAHMKLLEPG